MSVEAMTLVLHHSKAKGTAKLVLIGIANHEGDGGAWPAVVTLARYAGVDERSVQRALRTLEGMGEIRTMVQKGGLPDHPDELRPNLYRVNLACPPDCDRSAQHRTRHRQGPLIDPVTLVSPGDAGVTGGVTRTPPGGVTPVSPKPSSEPTMKPASVVTSLTDRARDREIDSVIEAQRAAESRRLSADEVAAHAARCRDELNRALGR